MGWTRGPGDCGVRLEIEVPVVVSGDGVIDDLFGTLAIMKHGETGGMLTVPDTGFPCGPVKYLPWRSSIR